MSNITLRTFSLALSLLLLPACAPVEKPQGPPPAQNLLGSTDQMQLVTELSMGLAKTYGGDRVLVVLEIDNTLLTTEQDAGCLVNSMHPIQEDVAQQVQRMQEAQLKVIVLTSRGTDCLDQTLQELDRNGLSFRASSWPPQGGYPGGFLPEGGDRTVIYQDGVFFTDDQDKGLMLHALLKKSGVPDPALIVMVDHEQDNLNAVMKAYSWTTTKVHAWRYDREDSAEPEI